MTYERENARAYESTDAATEYFDAEGLTTVEDDLVTTYFDPSRTVLDIGCGAGRTTRALLERGFDVAAFDMSARLLRHAKERTPELRCFRGDVTRLPVRDGAYTQALFSFNGFDMVFPLSAFEAGLREVHRVLAPDGVFIYSGHNIVGRFGRHNQSLKWAAAAMARQHPRFLMLQRRGARIREWYWRYDEPFGEIVAFSAPPAVHNRLHRDAGFRTVRIEGERGRRGGPFITLTSHHVHYVVQR